jgi:hypothetical protein
MIAASEREKTMHALDRPDTVAGSSYPLTKENESYRFMLRECMQLVQNFVQGRAGLNLWIRPPYH